MADDAIDLDSVRIRYDPRDGAFRLTSADPRLKGKPFMLTLSRESKAVASLLDVFRAEGIIRDEDLIPTRVTVQSTQRYDGILDEYTLAGKPQPHRDTRLSFTAGKISPSEVVAIDLGYAPHTLITGASGTGKTELLRSWARSALARESDIRILDPKDEGIGVGLPLSGGALSSGLPLVERTMRLVLEEYRVRNSKLHRSGALSSADYEAHHGAMAPLFVFADSLESFASLSWLSELLSFGEKVGIYILATAHSAFSIPALSDDSVLMNFDRRIALGVPSSPSEDSGISHRLLSNPGRGALWTYGSKPTVLQFVQTF